MTIVSAIKSNGSMTVEQIRDIVKRDVGTLKRELAQLEISGAVKFDGLRYSYNPRWKLRYS